MESLKTARNIEMAIGMHLEHIDSDGISTFESISEHSFSVVKNLACTCLDLNRFVFREMFNVENRWKILNHFRPN